MPPLPGPYEVAVNAHVHFSGPWTGPEAHALLEAVEEVRTKRQSLGWRPSPPPGPHTRPDLGKDWVAVKDVVAGRSYFFVHCAYLRSVHRGSTAEEVAERVRSEGK